MMDDMVWLLVERLEQFQGLLRGFGDEDIEVYAKELLQELMGTRDSFIRASALDLYTLLVREQSARARLKRQKPLKVE